MSERTRNVVYAVVILAMAGVMTLLVITSPTDVDRVERLGNRIKCPVCQGESIANSPSAMARDMMSVVEERVDQGWTDQEIVDELLASYSGAVLLDPPAAGSTLILWIAPAVALLVGAGVIIWWRRHPGKERDDDEPGPPTPSRRRILVGGLILAGAFAGIVVAAGFFLQDRDGPGTGVADLGGGDLADVSNETMEAVIEANSGDPQIAGMRLALAERYFGAGDYRAAFPHYLAVADSDSATSSQVVEALTRLGWMAWDGNGELEAAIGMFDQALAIDSSSSTARYLKGRVLWCGAGEVEQAADLFSQVLEQESLPRDSLAVVEDDFDAVTSGEPCT